MLKLREYRRVIGISELLFLAGRWLKRQGVKYTSVAALVGVCIIVSNIIGQRVFGYTIPVTNFRAFLIPTLTAVLTFGVGNILTGLSNLFSSQRILMADANALNLMEDCKKSQLEDHLRVLWQRVFQYEAQLEIGRDDAAEEESIQKRRDELKEFIRRWPEELKGHFGVTEKHLDDFTRHVACYQPLRANLEASEEGFLTSAAYAIRNSLPLKRERALTGCDLSLLEDWYDGAFFTMNDCKLKEQFAAHHTIRGVRQRVGIPWRVRLKEALLGHPDPLWFGLTMKKIGITIGQLIEQFNSRYVDDHEPSYFDAQDFLWKDEQTDRLVPVRFPENGSEIKRALQAARRKMVRSIFSASRRDAHRQIFRMFGRDYMNALDLRLQYDIEFVAGRLNTDPEEDVDELRKLFFGPVYSRTLLRERVSLARTDWEAVDRFLEAEAPDLFARPARRRAARIGFYLNRYKIQKLIATKPHKALTLFQERIVRATSRYSQRICLLRQHYELCRLQLLAYSRILDELGEYVVPDTPRREKERPKNE